MLEDLIHPKESYTIPGQTIFNNMYLVWDFLHLTSKDGLSLTFLSLTNEKSFNRVDGGYLMRTLQAFSFIPHFRGCRVYNHAQRGLDQTGHLWLRSTSGLPSVSPVVCHCHLVLPLSFAQVTDGVDAQ